LDGGITDQIVGGNIPYSFPTAVKERPKLIAKTAIHWYIFNVFPKNTRFPNAVKTMMLE
jgi:hypothetical protein